MRRRLVTAVLLSAGLAVAAACSSSSSRGAASSGASSSSATSSGASASSSAPVAPADVAARPSPGCSAATPVAPGQERIDTTAGGVARWYLRHIPASSGAAAPMPLVVDLHGYSEGAQIHALLSGLGAFGDAHGFITVHPQGGGAVARWDTEPRSADVAFIGQVLDEVEAAACVDTARVYATGLSNGAMFSSTLACALSTRLAAVGAVAGLSDPPVCAPARPVPIIAIHGTKDQFLAYDGGFGPAVADLPAPDGSGRRIGDLGDAAGLGRPSVPDAAKAWALRDGCGGTATETAVAADVALLAFPCPAGVDVELYRVDGGGHTWPGSAFAQKVESIVGFTTFSIDANQVLWDFFVAHPLPAGG